MPNAKAVHIPDGEGARLHVLGDVVTVKVHGRDTGGVFSQVETTCGPHIGPPMHVHHRESETFYVIEGDFEFNCAGEKFRASPGAVVSLPLGVPHRFENLSDHTGRVLVTVTPAGFENFFAEIHALTPVGQQDHAQVAAIGAKYGVEFFPPG